MKLALVQFAGQQDKRANLDRAAELAGQAAAQGAQIVCFHELVNTVYFAFEEHSRYFPWAESIPGPSTQFFADVARRHAMTLVVPLFECVGTEYYNTAVIIAPDGSIVGRYRKSSIPHIRRAGQIATGFEKYYFRPGDLGFPVFPTTHGVQVGVLICFDRHFPEHFRALALDGAQVIFVPTTSPRSGERAWLFELQAAAFANGCWVAGVNRVGLDEGGSPNDWFGRSVLINPKGDVVAEASDTEDEVLVCDFDPAQADEVRASWGFMRDRRPELYGRLAT